MTTAHAPSTPSVTPEERKVLAATLVGTAIEWYDYFIYAQAAGLVLAPLFFKPIANDNPTLALLLSFATVGISFLFRPLGALVCGHLGDRLGRKAVLVMTLILMGVNPAGGYRTCSDNFSINGVVNSIPHRPLTGVPFSPGGGIQKAGLEKASDQRLPASPQS